MKSPKTEFVFFYYAVKQSCPEFILWQQRIHENHRCIVEAAHSQITTCQMSDRLPPGPSTSLPTTHTCLFFVKVCIFSERLFSCNNRKWVSVMQRFTAVFSGSPNCKELDYDHLIVSLYPYYCIIHFYESITKCCYHKTKDDPLLWVSRTSEVAIFGFWTGSRSVCLSWFSNLEGGNIRMDKAGLTFWGQRVWICGSATKSICLLGIQDLECLESIFFFSHISIMKMPRLSSDSCTSVGSWPEHVTVFTMTRGQRGGEKLQLFNVAFLLNAN